MKKSKLQKQYKNNNSNNNGKRKISENIKTVLNKKKIQNINTLKTTKSKIFSCCICYATNNKKKK